MLGKVLALLVVFYRPDVCERCDEFQRKTLTHPIIERRLPKVSFEVCTGAAEPAVVLVDHHGRPRVRWAFVPDTMNFAIILDSIAAVAPHFESAAALPDGDAELEIGTALARLQRRHDARDAFVKAREQGSPETRQAAEHALELLDAPPSRAASAPRGPIRILPLEQQVVRGSHTVRTHVTSSVIARAEFSLDGRVVQRAEHPPFAATLDFGAVPERHTIRVAAFDRAGREVGRDERVVNEAGETFWLRITSPVAGPASGKTLVTLNVRLPAARRVRRVVISWNGAERAVLSRSPWESAVTISNGQVGVLRAVAELDDGRTSEDAVLLNAHGFGDAANVQLVELPITIPGAVGELTPDRITVTEGTRTRRVEAVAAASETPLTVGLLIDVSDSMHKTLPDLQEAAMRFLQATLGEECCRPAAGDPAGGPPAVRRAFLVTFDSHARLIQPATNDVAVLHREIMRIRPDGLTSLHDAMVLGLLQFEGIRGRRAMIVFTDGLDRTSHYRASDVSELARRVNVPIHIIESIPGEPSTEALPLLAFATGGTAHRLEKLEELPSVYSLIEQSLRNQFLAYFRTDPATRENDWRSVKVTVSGHDSVYAPEGYYAGW